ncbi:hypothetical protein [Fluviispira multicolorata]|uniref:Uncharacterized protein n=1 Tax=Fluviispira multicolorata TaxID=2654512 RepID=A0A833JBK9_9BACT|nr:hypothetical protein [Fluviispira multicolorata]KAB8028542.1 hypothetical protein GCL57_12525 [Fluviispira multicolorata]
MELIVANNIVHKLNQMLLVISGNSENQLKLKSLKESSAHVEYFLTFTHDAREEMAQYLGISLKTLHRIYENPIKILDDYALVTKISEYFGVTYPDLIQSLFITSSQDLQLNVNTSEFLKEIILIDKELSIEARRELVRILVLIRKLKIPIENFSIVARKMIYKKCFFGENFNRVKTLIDNI